VYNGPQQGLARGRTGFVEKGKIGRVKSQEITRCAVHDRKRQDANRNQPGVRNEEKKVWHQGAKYTKTGERNWVGRAIDVSRHGGTDAKHEADYPQLMKFFALSEKKRNAK